MPNSVQSVNGKCEANKDNGICHVIEIKTAINHINTLFLPLNTYSSGFNTIYGIYDKILYAKSDSYVWSVIGAEPSIEKRFEMNNPLVFEMKGKKQKKKQFIVLKANVKTNLRHRF